MLAVAVTSYVEKSGREKKKKNIHTTALYFFRLPRVNFFSG